MLDGVALTVWETVLLGVWLTVFEGVWLTVLDGVLLPPAASSNAMIDAALACASCE